MPDLVVCSLEAWDGVWRRNQHLIAGLLRRGVIDQVLFVEPPVDHFHDVVKGRIPQFGQTGIREIAVEGLSRRRLFALRQWKVLPRRLDPNGDRRRARGVVKVAERLGLSRPVLWINDPGGHDVLRETGWPSLYDITDDWLAADRPARELERMRAQEQVLLDRCKAVVVCSPKLLEKGLDHKPALLVPNAVDMAAYRQAWARPRMLPQGPVALYVGTLHRDRLDVELTVKTAERVRGSGVVALLGPIALEVEDLKKLERAGVQLMGPVPSASVPAFLQHADVLILPHVVSPFTESLDPIKAYEYKAAGRPVVATRVPGFVGDASGVVRIAGQSDFPGRVLELLKDKVPSVHNPEVPDWRVRVLAMEEILLGVQPR